MQIKQLAAKLLDIDAGNPGLAVALDIEGVLRLVDRVEVSSFKHPGTGIRHMVCLIDCGDVEPHAIDATGVTRDALCGVVHIDTTNNPHREFGKALTQLRRNVHMTEIQACNVTQISPTDLRRFERGRVLPDSEQMRDLARAYGVRPGWLDGEARRLTRDTA